jgi:hypothetical protein
MEMLKATIYPMIQASIPKEKVLMKINLLHPFLGLFLGYEKEKLYLFSFH